VTLRRFWAGGAEEAEGAAAAIIDFVLPGLPGRESSCHDSAAKCGLDSLSSSSVVIVSWHGIHSW
jgi:hypothetical protein